MLRVTALLTVLALAAPSFAALVCDWTCASSHELTAASGAACHDTGLPQSDSPAIAAGHVCHEPLDGPRTVIRSAAQLSFMPAILRVAHIAVDEIDHHVAAPAARLNAHDPPPFPVPLRI